MLAGGDFLSAVAQIYVDVIGPIFYGVFVFLLVWPIYLRTQSVLIPVIILIFLGSMIELALPASVLVMVRGVISILIAASLFYVATRGRST